MHTKDLRLIIPHGPISFIVSWVNSDWTIPGGLRRDSAKDNPRLYPLLQYNIEITAIHIHYHLLPAQFGSYPMLFCFAFASLFFLNLSNTRAEKPATNPPPIRPIRPPYIPQNSLKISEGVKGSKTVTVKFAIAVMRLSVGIVVLYLFAPINSEGIADPVDKVTSTGIVYSPGCAFSGTLTLNGTGSTLKKDLFNFALVGMTCMPESFSRLTKSITLCANPVLDFGPTPISCAVPGRSSKGLGDVDIIYDGGGTSIQPVKSTILVQGFPEESA